MPASLATPLVRLHGRRAWTDSDLPIGRVLQPNEILILAAIAELETPEPERSIAAVASYVDAQLAGPLIRLLPAFRQGFAAIEEDCTARSGRHFADLNDEERLLLIMRFRSGHKLTAFFSLLARQCRRAILS